MLSQFSQPFSNTGNGETNLVRHFPEGHTIKVMQDRHSPGRGMLAPEYPVDEVPVEYACLVPRGLCHCHEKLLVTRLGVPSLVPQHVEAYICRDAVQKT
jgi:hypothetical protein